MTPARWQQVKETLASAMERNSTAERASFLAEACANDTALRREVESLLGQSAGALDSWADSGGFVGSDPSLSRNEGRRIGAYRLVRELGRGGMGAVWLATRADEEFRKTVAIKLLKRGTDTDEVLRRFRAEREILARLEHPNIARLLDGGTTDDGLPYFVMEYVEGTRLTDYVTKAGLSLTNRLQLFLKICSAVQFAHQNLIVHRDLKPANILVTSTGEPKLLDFGIAKLLAEDEAWEATIAGRERLTPAYASPEQILGQPITTVSDVYSLGALLYEILTERPPHSFSAERPTPTELQRVICESDPARPSVVAIPPEMRRSLRGDLETIILRAMSREPARRYPGAGELGNDLIRYQEGWPVRARRDTLFYRFGKFARRNKLVVAIALLILAGSAVTLWEANKAERERARADLRFQQVRKIAHAVLFDYHDQIANLPGSTQVRERLVKDALAYLDQLSGDAAADRSLQRELAAAYAKVAQIQGNTYYSNLGHTDAALQSYRKSLALRQELQAANPNDPEASFELAQSYQGVGDALAENHSLTEALAAYQAALTLLEKIAGVSSVKVHDQLALIDLYIRIGDVEGVEGYPNLGDNAAALVSYQKAESLLDQLASSNPKNRAIESKKANVLRHLGSLYDSAGDIRNALSAGHRSVKLMDDLLSAAPTNQNYRVGLLASKAFLRGILTDSNQLPEAITLSKATITELQTMGASDPKNIQLQRNLAVTHNALGRDLLAHGEAKAAEEEHKMALSFFEEKAAANPESKETRSDLAFTEIHLGEAYLASGDYKAAIDCDEKALQLVGSPEVAGPSNAKEQQNLSLLYSDLGKALAVKGDSAKARQSFTQAISLAEKLSAFAPSNAKLRATLALRYAELGEFELQLGQNQAAHDGFARCLDIFQELDKAGRLLPIYQSKLAELNARP